MAHPRSTLHSGQYGQGHAHAQASASSSNLSTADQLMQLDSAITATLQEIDANFARAHQIVTATLLPAVNVYGQHSAKAWHSAKFWQDFFITAAHIPIKRVSDESTARQDDEEVQTEVSTYASSAAGNAPSLEDDSENSLVRQASGRRRHVDGEISDESTRIFREAGNLRGRSPPRLSNASRKAVGRGHAKPQDAFDSSMADSSMHDSDASWANVESPFDRLKREVRTNGDASMDATEALLARRRAERERLLTSPSASISIEQSKDHIAHSVGKLRGTEDLGPSKRSPARLRDGSRLLNKVLSAEQRKANSGVKSHFASSSTPKRSSSTSDPLAKEGARPSSGLTKDSWDGIADLRKTPLSTRITKGRSQLRSSSAKKQGFHPKSRHTDSDMEDDDDDSLAWPEGMSPPVTMQFSVPQSKYAKTPAKEAAKLLVDDLLRTAEAGPATLRRERERKVALATVAKSPRVGGTTRSDKQLSKGVLAGPSVATTPLRTRQNRPSDGKRAATGAQKRRDSMPTPPTLTRYGVPVSRNSASPTSASGAKGSRTDATASTAKPFAASKGKAALLLDEGEGGVEEDEEEGRGAGDAMLLSSGTSAYRQTDLDSLLDVKITASDDDDEEEEEEEEEESDSDSESEDDEDPLAGRRTGGQTAHDSVAGLSSFSSTATRTGWSTSSKTHRGASLDNDTLFGVGKSSNPRELSSSAEANKNSQALTGAPHFKMMGQLEDTVQGGKLLEDKDLTYSAPSPTPWK